MSIFILINFQYREKCQRADTIITRLSSYLFVRIYQNIWTSSTKVKYVFMTYVTFYIQGYSDFILPDRSNKNMDGYCLHKYTRHLGYSLALSLSCRMLQSSFWICWMLSRADSWHRSYCFCFWMLGLLEINWQVYLVQLVWSSTQVRTDGVNVYSSYPSEDCSWLVGTQQSWLFGTQMVVLQAQLLFIFLQSCWAASLL